MAIAVDVVDLSSAKAGRELAEAAGSSRLLAETWGRRRCCSCQEDSGANVC